MTSQEELAREIHAAMLESHAKWGVDTSDYTPHDGVYVRLGRKGVIAIIGDYVHTYIPDDDRLRSVKDATRLYQRLLDEGKRILFTVYYLNFPSIIAIKKLGSTLLGVDEDNFFHYELKVLKARGRLHGQEGTETT